MPDIAIEDLSSLEDKVGGAHPFGPTRHFQSVGRLVQRSSLSRVSFLTVQICTVTKGLIKLIHMRM